jgi:pimeloyl-ACP methyl ester carboxylesterase
MLCDEQLWQRPAEELGTDRDVRCVPLSGSSVAAAVEAVLALPLPRFDLAGLSLGGIVAMHVAVRAPERLRRLALLSTNARAPRPDQYQAWDLMQRRALDGELAGVARDLVPSLLRPDAQHDPVLVATTLRMAQATGVAAFLEQLDLQRSRTDLLGRLGDAGCRTLVVSAQDDALCPPHLLQEIADALPLSRLETIPACGHLSPLERPQAVTRLLRGWLDAPHEELDGAAPARAGSAL